VNGSHLPASCAACVYFPSLPAQGGRCRRHAPSPCQEAFEVARWPRVRQTDRCGSGAAVTDGTGPGMVTCVSCAHWLQPNGEPIRPDYRKGLAVEWWAESGYCTRLAPSPSSEEDRRAFWKVTHATDGCGDGDAA
jgi:hypothetical protein